MPSAFKQLVDANTVTQFYVTSTDGKSQPRSGRCRSGRKGSSSSPTPAPWTTQFASTST